MPILLKDFLLTFLTLHLHWAVFAGTFILLNKKAHLPDEVFRKLLHLTAVFAIIPIVLTPSNWLAAVMVCVAFQLEAFFGAKFSDMEKGIAMKERKEGEQQRSMLLLFGTYIFLILNCWGAMGQKWMVILSVVAWGVGDCFAALVGKRFGKHKIQGKWVDGVKSVEGTVANFVTSATALFLLYQGHTVLTSNWLVLLVCIWVALFSAIAELCSKDGMDTVICPLIAMSGLLILNFAAGGI